MSIPKLLKKNGETLSTNSNFICLDNRIININYIANIYKNFQEYTLKKNPVNYMIQLNNRERIYVFPGTDDFIYIDYVFKTRAKESKTILEIVKKIGKRDINSESESDDDDDNKKKK